MSLPRRLIQITDLHFCERPGDILCSGLVTDDSLRLVLDLLARREPHGAPVIVTGDLVQDPVPAAYRRLSATLAEYPFTFHCLPGNHDDAALMRRHLNASNIVTEPQDQVGAWRFIMLDSSVTGVPYGRLGTEETAHLRDFLDSTMDDHALLALHHHPVAVRSPWMDRMALTDSGALFDAVERSSRVKAVLFGHVHQEVDQIRSGTRMLGTPSTCVQFAPHTLTMSLDGHAPAYRWLDLHPDGHLDTGVVYLAAEWRQASA